MTTEPKLKALPTPRRLTLVERVAAEAVMAEVARAQQRLRELFAEMGLDETKSYRLMPDGTLEEV